MALSYSVSNDEKSLTELTMAESHLTGVVSCLSSSTEAAGRHDEDLLSHRVDLPHTLPVIDNGHPGLAYPQWDGSSWK